MKSQLIGRHLLVFFVCLYVFCGIGHYGGDGYQDYLTAESIVLDRNLSLYDRPGDPDQLNYQKNLGTQGRDAKIYSSRGSLGVPILLAFFYALGHLLSLLFRDLPHDFLTMLVSSFYNPVITALGVYLVYCVALKLNYSIKHSFIMSCIYGLTTMNVVYSRTGFSEPTLVVFLLLALWAAISYSRSFRTVHIVIVALALAYCVLVKPTGLLFIAPFTVYLFWAGRQKNNVFAVRKLTAFVLLLVFLCVLIFAYNYYIYGGLLKFGKHNAGSGTQRIILASHMLKGFFYYLVSPGKGFFLFNAPLILACFGVRHAYKVRKKETVLLLLIIAINLLFYVKSFRRGSLFSWGPRYLTLIVPMLVFFLGDYLERYRLRFARILLSTLSVIGALILAPCMLINQSKFYFFVKEKLLLDEYLINFIPDLSPIKGAWFMLHSRLVELIAKEKIPFVYNPDYFLHKAIMTYADGYNMFETWYFKILEYAPGYHVIVYLAIFILVCIAAISLLIALFKSMASST